MFTGLVEAVSPVIANAVRSGGRRLSVDLGMLAEDSRVGDSICVNGVCLTISELGGDRAYFDAVAETVRISTLGELKVGDRVNLERAMRADGRFGGHMVQGHVDGVGRVARIDRGEAEHVMTIEAEGKLMDLMIEKGSVTVDGVSLTIVSVKGKEFGVSLIPTTLAGTNLNDRKVADKVNLEADLVSKWIRKRLDAVFG